MPDDVCIKGGGIDDKDVRDFNKTSVEFYCKDRVGYSRPVEGAEQKPVSSVGSGGNFGWKGQLTFVQVFG